MSQYDIFISHSSKDSDRVKWLVEALEDNGYRCWIAPRDISPGMPYARAIMQGIDSCDTFVVVITSRSVTSEDVLNEIDNAHAQHKRMIPVFMEDVELPREFNYYLSRTQWVRLGENEREDIVARLGLPARVSVAGGPVVVPAAKASDGRRRPTVVMYAGLALSVLAFMYELFMYLT